MAALVISFSQELFYYIARSSCAKCNEAVSAFIVLREVSVVRILLAITNSFNKVLMKCLFLL